MVLKKVGELWDKILDVNPESIYPLGHCYNGDVLINGKKLTPKNNTIRIGDYISIKDKVKCSSIEEVFPYEDTIIKCGLLSIGVENLLTAESRDALFFSTNYSIWAVYERNLGEQDEV